MDVLHCDLTCGVAGDMLMAAFLDLEPDCLDWLNHNLSLLNLGGAMVQVSHQCRGGFAGLSLEVVHPQGVGTTCWLGSYDVDHESHHAHPCRTLHHIDQLLSESGLPQRVKNLSAQTFRLIAEAEAKVHGKTVEHVHFHEVGAIDSIVDVVGCCLMFDRLGCPRVMGTDLNLGGGFVHCAHGKLAVPAPAVAVLSQGLKVYGEGDFERATPTGVALLRSFQLEQVDCPVGVMNKRGVGLGRYQKDQVLNGLTLTGRTVKDNNSDDQVWVIETFIDDMNPQDWPMLETRLFESGALDFFLTQGMMKKGRPAVHLTVLVSDQNFVSVQKTLWRHSTAIGCRYRRERRLVLQRQIDQIELDGFCVHRKRAYDGEVVVNRSIEFEDLRQISFQTGRPIKELRQEGEKISGTQCDCDHRRS